MDLVLYRVCHYLEIAIGLIIKYLHLSGGVQWRFPIGFQAVFAACLLLQVTVLPDSPRWLLAHGQVEEASKVIALLEDHDAVDHPDVVRAREDIEASLALESEGGRYSVLVRCLDTYIYVNCRTFPLQ